MPLPDADKKSPRVYRNLKQKDLEDVTFANMEATGDPISIEMLNEDELRRLVLVNLARLSVKGEWNGLLTSGATTQQFNLEADSGATQIVPTDGTGTLSIDGGTGISTATGGANDQVVVTNTGVTSLTAGTNITLSGSTGSVTVSAAGGGGSSFGYLIKTPFSNTYKIFQISNFAPFAAIGISSSSTYFANTRPTGFPFIAPFDGSINDAQLSVSTGQTGAKVNVGIYTLDSNNYPDAKVAEIEFDGSSSGTKSSASISQTSDLVAGDPYYYVVWGYGGAVQCTLSAIDDEHTAGIAPGFSLNTAQVPNSIRGANLTTGTVLPSTFNLTGADGPSTVNRPLFALIQDP